jgi:hypothetical protein
MSDTINQDQRANFRTESGQLYLVRCYACEPNGGRENWMPAVADGRCAWCGWEEEKSK